MKESRSQSRNCFTTLEDNLLSKIMENQSFSNWKMVAQNIPGRSARQCRARWLHYLAPWINKEQWTAEEDEIIMQKVIEYGRKWAKISKFLEGRTDNDIKNHWYSCLSKNLKQVEISKPIFDIWTEFDLANSSFIDKDMTTYGIFLQMF
jgi:hypothetical protein